MILTFGHYCILRISGEYQSINQLASQSGFGEQLINEYIMELEKGGLLSIRDGRSEYSPYLVTRYGYHCLEEFERQNPTLIINPASATGSYR